MGKSACAGFPIIMVQRASHWQMLPCQISQSKGVNTASLLHSIPQPARSGPNKHWEKTVQLCRNRKGCQEYDWGGKEVATVRALRNTVLVSQHVHSTLQLRVELWALTEEPQRKSKSWTAEQPPQFLHSPCSGLLHTFALDLGQIQK